MDLLLPKVAMATNNLPLPSNLDTLNLLRNNTLLMMPHLNFNQQACPRFTPTPT